MAILRCPVDETIFQSDKGWPGPTGHIDCPGPSCTEMRGGPPDNPMGMTAPPPGPPPGAGGKAAPGPGKPAAGSGSQDPHHDSTSEKQSRLR